MSNANIDNLTKKKVQQLLIAAGSGPIEDTTQINYTEYDWYQPNFLGSNQLRRLDAFTKTVAVVITQKFTELCHTDYNATITSITQHFTEKFFNEAAASEQSDHYVAFGIDKEQGSQTQDGTLGILHPCGLLGIPPKTAIAWVTQLLGDSESEKDPTKPLSQLEESLLFDIASDLIDAFSDSYGNYNLLPDKGIIRGHLPLEAENIEETCKITFSVERTHSNKPSEAYFLMPCRRLDPIVEETAQDSAGFSPEDISNVILNHLQQMPVSVVAQLASTVLSFEETMNLQAGDILLLDKRTDDTLDLVVEGRSLFRGRPARAGSTYAVVITEPCSDKE